MIETYFNKESMKRLAMNLLQKFQVDEVTMLNLYTGTGVMNPNVPVQTRYEIIKIANDI